MPGLLDTLGELAAAGLRATAADRFAARPELFDPVGVLVPALAVIHGRDPAWQRLWEHSAEFLLRRSGTPPASPTDWRQDVKLACSCDWHRSLEPRRTVAGEKMEIAARSAGARLARC